MKHLVFFILLSVGVAVHAQVVDIDFEDGSCGNAASGSLTAAPVNGAAVVDDAQRGGKALLFNAAQKGCLQLDAAALADTLSIAFWGKREDADPNAQWRMFFALYAPDGSNIYLTPKTSWGANAFLIVDNKPYATYKSLSATPLNNNQWYHFAAVFADNVVRLFIDGAMQFEARTLFRLSDFGFTKFYFGCNPDLNYPMTGRIDDIKIYHSALYDNQIAALAKDLALPPPLEDATTALPAVTLTPDISTEYQTVSNFGASDGWNAQTIGRYFPLEKKEKIAELLFSQDTFPDGSPKGIALSSWRFNIGAGTAEQGEASRIDHYTRRTECFLNADGATWDWSKQAGQQWFLRRAALHYGVPDIIGWQNSPPVYFTARGLGFREYGDPKNSILKKEYYPAFGEFLAAVVNHFKDEGITFKYISPLNEPQWDWAATAANGAVSQEGTPWTNAEIAATVTAIDAAFTNKNVAAKQFITEAGAIDYILNGSAAPYGQQLATFWGAAAMTALPSFSNIVSSHSYWSDTSPEEIVTARNSLRSQMRSLNPALEYWQTEYCLMGTGYKFGHTATATLSSMECAVSVARIIHADLTEADAAAWQWWTAFELDSKAGAEDRYALIRFELNSGATDGVYLATKLLYALGNYSRFVRPGMKRIQITADANLTAQQSINNQMFSAFVNDSMLTIVVINAREQPVPVRITAPDNLQVSHFTPYLTSPYPADNLRRCPNVAVGEEFIMPAKSVATFTARLNTPTANQSVTAGSCRVYPNPANKALFVAATEPIREITLFNACGSMMTSVNATGVECRLQVDTFAKGAYFVLVKCEKNTYSHKILII